MGALWGLKDSNYEIHLYEKNRKPGGHTNTQRFRSRKTTVDVDTGFIVMNSATYPNFLAFLDHVGISPKRTEMTFSVSRDRGAFEWSGEAQGVFAQRRNFFRPQHWRMLFDIVRFNQFALDLLYQDDGRLEGITIGEYLDREQYSQSFRDEYLIPMTAAVWSTSPDKSSLGFPAAVLVRFMWNHHLLSTLATRPAWLTIPGGSQRYIDKVLAQYNASASKRRLHVHLDTEIVGLEHSEKHKVVLLARSADGHVSKESFDHAILACHGDEILPILSSRGLHRNAADLDHDWKSTSHEDLNGDVSREELDIFKCFKTTKNTCYLHSDLAFMPQRRSAWTSWNYLVSSNPSQQLHPAGVSLTYNMNTLQHFDQNIHGPVLVTMNPEQAPSSQLTQGEFTYRHPLYTTDAVRAQQRLRSVQNVRGISYCGAWTKYGFHEDGFTSGLLVAQDHLGAKVPFTVVDSTYSRGHKPTLCKKDYLLRFVVSMLLFALTACDFVLAFPGISLLVALGAQVGSAMLDVLEHAGIL